MRKILIVISILLALFTAPILASAAPFIVTQGGTAQGSFTAGLLYSPGGTNAFQTTATTTASCSGNTSCSSFTILGSSPVTISSSGGGGGITWPWTMATTYGTTTDSTTTPLWLKTALYASSTPANPSVIDSLTSTNSTTSILFIGSNYRTKWLSGPDYLDIQNTSITSPASEERILSNLVNAAQGAEATRSAVVDCSGQNLFNNQNFLDTSIDMYTTSYNAIIADVGAGTCPAIPLEFQVRMPGANVNQSTSMILFPSGTVGFVNNTTGTSSVPLSAKVYIASTTATQLLEIDSTLGNTTTLGTPVFTVLQNGKVGVATSSPSDAFTVSVGNNAGLRVASTNSGFLEVGQSGADRWRIQNDFTQSGQLELLYNAGTGNAPSNTSMTWVGNTAAAGSAAGNVGIASTTPGSLLAVGGVANFTTATSTFYSSGGINIKSGCFALNGACLAGSSLTLPVSTANGGTGTSTWLTKSIPFFDGTKFTEDAAALQYDDSIGQLLVYHGQASFPGYSFVGFTQTGMWEANSGETAFSNASGETFQTVGGNLRQLETIQAGTAASPVFTNTNDTQKTGLYFPNSGKSLGLSADGALNLLINSSGASTTNFANFARADFGGTATSSFLSNGSIQWSDNSTTTSNGVLIVEDEESNNTAGGNAFVGKNSRVLNTVVANTINGASLSSNEVILPAGTYRIVATTPEFAADRAKAVWFNTTDNSTTTVGTTGFSDGSTGNAISQSNIDSRFTISGTKTFDLYTYVQTNRGTNGLGLPANLGMTEVYSQVQITKE